MSTSSTPVRMPSSAGRPEQAFPPLLVICGPTATGKTSLSLALAEQLPGAEIISADSRQVYRGMDIGTAKVSAADRERVRHHGLDLADPDERFTAADFARHARAALGAIRERGGFAILVGGTGLYLRSVARGLRLEETGSDPDTRARLEERLAGEGLHVLVAELRSRAPAVAAGIDLNNPRRVVRALERAHVTGDRPPPPPGGYPGRLAWVGLDTDSATSDRWIGERARWQYEHGLLEEATTLRKRFDPALPAFTAMGYSEAFAVLDGALAKEQAIDRTAQRTRRFARRQRTWFRAEPGIEWLRADADPLPAALALASGLIPA